MLPGSMRRLPGGGARSAAPASGRAPAARRRLPLAAAAALALGAAAPAAGCQLVLDFAPLSDAGGDGEPLGDGSPLCAAGEPNDTAAEARPIAFGAAVEAALCGDRDLDYHGFTVDGMQDVIARLTYPAGSGNLDLQIWSVADNTALTVGLGVDGEAQIEHSEMLGNRLAAGDYAALVVASQGASGTSYELEIQLGDGSMPDAGPPGADASP